MLRRASIWPCVLGLILSAVPRAAHATIGLVVGEPFGSFGTMLPVGHAGIYLDHLCLDTPDTPTHLRLCHPGEYGVVLSRYHDLESSQLDWLATPALTFFYGADTTSHVPAYITPALRDQIRIAYRNAHLRTVVPDPLVTRTGKDGALHFKDGEDWQESIGSTFDRRLFLYTIATTPQQDSALLAYINDLPNHRAYALGRANCADWAADMLRIVLPTQKPTILRRNILADFDITTPKALARQLDAFGKQHPQLDFAVYEIPQLPGTTRRSRPLRSSAELFLTTRRYLFTLIVLQPEFILVDTAAYTAKGRWKPGRDAIPITPTDWPLSPTQPADSTTTANTF